MLIVIFPFLAFLGATLLSAVLGLTAVLTLESANLRKAAQLLQQGGYEWPLLRADGTMIQIAGSAPNQEERKGALLLLEDEFAPKLILNRIAIKSAEAFSPLIRIQKSGNSIVLFGTIVGAETAQRVKNAAEEAFPDLVSLEGVQILDGPEQVNLLEDVVFALQAIAIPEVSLVIIENNSLGVHAITMSESAKRDLLARLEGVRPNEREINYQLTSPLPPLIEPFRLHLTLQAQEANFTRCHVETASDRDRIMRAASGGNTRQITGNCANARGAPDPAWADVIESIIIAVNNSGGGAIIRAENFNMTITPIDETSLKSFQTNGLPNLPNGYTVLVTELGSVNPFDDLEDFTIVIEKGADGYLEFSGTFANDTDKRVALLTSQVALNVNSVQDNTIIDASVSNPASGDQIILASEALKLLYKGSAKLRGDLVLISGLSEDAQIEAQISELLSEQLTAEDFLLDIAIDETLNKPPPPMKPELCLQLLEDTQKPKKITFDPSSTRIRAEALDIIDQMVEVLQNCQHVSLIIAGHTDSQGREEMNQTLSQLRAMAVLDAIIDAGFVAENITIFGFGETQPIADNSTEEGREENRRIEFRLLELQEPEPLQ